MKEIKDLRKLFGTDGIRGVANLDLTPELVIKIGRAGAKYLSADSRKKQIIIGRDTRPSGEFIQNALISAILSSGVNVLDAGIITTPAIALLAKLLDLDGGIVISASHNPVEDNGIKFFGKGGQKLTDDKEKAIEDYILDSEENSGTYPTGLSVGRLNCLDNANEIYLNYLLSKFSLNLSGLKIALDCANGAAGVLAPKALQQLGANVIEFNTELTGENINKNCGSTHPEFLSKKILEIEAEIGFSYDGDGDRVIAFDSKGRILDGDIIIAFCAMYMSEKGFLRNNCVVTTVMANMGFDRVLESKDIKIHKTNVGDRYVLEKMLELDCMLGGEQSGHIIFSDLSPTGDGIISTLEFLNVLINNKYNLEKIYDTVPKFPQVLKNVRVTDKDKILTCKEVKNKISEIEKKLAGNGRLLVRPSGTEPLIRVMVEAQSQDVADKATSELSEVIMKCSQNL